MTHLFNKKNSQYAKDSEFLFSSLKNKKIPTKYLYDEKGSKLFEEICSTKEYYITRTEKKILNKYSVEILRLSNVKELFELGSGSSKKTKVLIKEALKNQKKIKYTSFDISQKALNMSMKELKNISNKLEIDFIKGDFFKDLRTLNKKYQERMYLFLGSTIGNFNNDLAIKFLSNISKVMKKGDFLLLGVDKIKDRKIIKSAYNDKYGITEKFNKNILNVINKKYKLNFNKNNFSHEAIFNEDKKQIEMYLKSKVFQKIQFPDKKEIYFRKGDNILTEISRKFSDRILRNLFAKSSLQLKKSFTDDKKFFSIYLLKSK